MQSPLVVGALRDQLLQVLDWYHHGPPRFGLESRRISEPHPWLDALARPNRAPLVEALAVYFDPDTSPEEVMAFQAMAGVLTPARCPTELFLLTKHKPTGWPA